MAAPVNNNTLPLPPNLPPRPVFVEMTFQRHQRNINNGSPGARQIVIPARFLDIAGKEGLAQLIKRYESVILFSEET